MGRKHDGMTRTQVQIGSRQYEGLKRLAARRGVSLSQLVREGVDSVLSRADKDDRRRNLLSIVGKYGKGGTERVSEEHDRYLDEIYGDWDKST
jgi:hypothetical protein